MLLFESQLLLLFFLYDNLKECICVYICMLCVTRYALPVCVTPGEFYFLFLTVYHYPRFALRQIKYVFCVMRYHIYKYYI